VDSMKRSSGFRDTPAHLPEMVHHQLNMYALAASAAGVGMLALAQPAEAKIIYTKANKHIRPNTMAHLDLNHDGIIDFGFNDTFASSENTGQFFAELSVFPNQKNNAVRGYAARNHPYASALSSNKWVGPGRKFLSGAGVMAITYSTGGLRLPPFDGVCTGLWGNVKNHYLGFKFMIKGKTHFGWARLSVKCSVRISATLTGYAYETIPNKPILTGRTKESNEANIEEPEATLGSLGVLALGSRGLSIKQRKEQLATH
jgi:hypothetical protein